MFSPEDTVKHIDQLLAGSELQLPRWDYRTVAEIARVLQPSYTEDAFDASAPRIAANILAFSRRIVDARVEKFRKAALDEYRRLESVRSSEASFEQALLDFPATERVAGLKDRMISSYLNVYIYHNAEHMLTMARDCVLFGSEVAAQFDYSAAQRSRFLKRLLFAGLYHDSGNGRFPRDEVGRDELEAVEIFLTDVKAAKSDSRLSLLVDLERDDVIQVAADILATIFRDRHADTATLCGREYVAECVSLLEKYGYPTSTEDLAGRMRSKEAMIVQNADISSSLETGSLIKNTFTVYFENLLKSNIFAGKSFADNRRGFIALLRGRLQSVMHGSETPLSLEAQQGNLLLNPDSAIDIFRERNQSVPETERELLLLLAYDRAICEGMCRVIEDNIRSGKCDVLSAEMSAIAPLLRARLGHEAFAPYSGCLEIDSPFRSLIDMTQHEVSAIFGKHTQEILSAIENGARDARPEVRELVAAFGQLQPDTWQGHYLCEILRFAGLNPHDHSLRVIDALPGTEPLVRKGDESVHSYVLLGGSGRVEAIDAGKTVNTILPVNVAGEMAVFFGQRTADLVVSCGPIRMLHVPEHIVRSISQRRELKEVLDTGIALRLAHGDLITGIDDLRLREFLDKVISFSISALDPLYPPELQVAMQREELAGTAHERGWEVCRKGPGETFIFKGEKPGYVFVVIDGSACVHVPGMDEPIARGPGSLLGEMSLLSETDLATADVCGGPEGAELICVPRDLVAACKSALELLAEKRITAASK